MSQVCVFRIFFVFIFFHFKIQFLFFFHLIKEIETSTTRNEVINDSKNLLLSYEKSRYGISADDSAMERFNEIKKLSQILSSMAIEYMRIWANIKDKMCDVPIFGALTHFLWRGPVVAVDD